MQSPDINSQSSMHSTHQPVAHLHHHNYSTDYNASYSSGMLQPQHTDDNLTGELTYHPNTSKYVLPDGFEHFHPDKLALTETLLSAGSSA